MQFVSLLRISFPRYDSTVIMDMIYELAKFRGIQILGDDDSIRLFHHYQKLVHDSRQPNGLDPFPIKHVGNFGTMLEPMSQMFQGLSKTIGSVMSRLGRK